jgi:hypothetical protein
MQRSSVAVHDVLAASELAQMLPGDSGLQLSSAIVSASGEFGHSLVLNGRESGASALPSLTAGDEQ